MKTYCLFDTNALIKYYVPLPGSDIVNYLIDKNTSIQTNITNVQIAEVISLFYSFRGNGILTSDEHLRQAVHTFLNDIKTKKINVYDLANEHLLDFEVYKQIAKTPAPNIKLPFVRTLNGIEKGFKDKADNTDTLILLIMREMQLLSNKNAYLITIDSHLKAIAKNLNLNTLDPEQESMESLPNVLDIRNNKRTPISVKAFCSYYNSNNHLPLMRTLDISDKGLCLEVPEQLRPNEKLSIKLTTDDYDNAYEITGKIRWSNAKRAGIELDKPITVEALLN